MSDDAYDFDIGLDSGRLEKVENAEYEMVEETSRSQPTLNNTGIPTAPEWDIIDSSKLDTFATCERKFFYTYILGWRPEQTSIHLHYGTSVHLAMEHILLHGFSNETILSAYQLFLSSYREVFDESLDAKYAPKDPANTFQLLAEYAAKYQSQDEDTEVLYTEVAGSVPIDDETLIHFKIDAILRDKRGIFIRDHKTASQLGDAKRKEFDLSVQIGTYVHALYCFPQFPNEEIYGGEINLLVLRKMGNALERLPIQRNPADQAKWLWNTQFFINMLRWNMEAFSENSPEDEILTCFPQRWTSCTKYGVCPFHSLYPY